MNNIECDKTFAQITIKGKERKSEFIEAETEPISEYMMKKLDIDIGKYNVEEKNLLLKNFVHLICNVMPYRC